MGVGDELSVVENSLRDLIDLVLRKAHGDSWFEQLGVADQRVEQWKARRAEEPKRRPGGEVDSRLLYYADFYDAIEIIRKNWDIGFNRCFGDRKRFEVYTDRLSAFRNPDAHSRTLLPFEEHLVLGMSGELRQEITLFLSSGAAGPEPEYFPRIEEVRDSYGTRVVGRATGPGHVVYSGVVLRPGDKVSFVARAWDPADAVLDWSVAIRSDDRFEFTGSELQWEWLVEERDISENVFVEFRIRSKRAYHRSYRRDDDAVFAYKVLPPRS